MKFYLISDNTYTLVGMRMAGIEGVLIKTKIEFEKALRQAIKMQDIAVVLVTEKFMNLCKDLILNVKTTYKKPLITIIPDRHNSGLDNGEIMKYVKEAVGVKI